MNDRARMALPLMQKCVWTFLHRVPPTVEREEMASAAGLGLAKAAVSFRDGGEAFSSWAWGKMWGAMLDQLRIANPNLRRLHPVELVSLEQPHPLRPADTIADSLVAPDRVADLAAARVDVVRALRTLPRRDCEVVLLQAAGVSTAELAQRYGVTGHRINQLAARGRARVAEAIAA